MVVLIAIIGIIGVVGGAIVYGVIVSAIILSALWGWFLTPLFGVPVPPPPLVVGFSIVVHYLSYQDTPSYKNHEVNTTYDIVIGMIRPWIIFFIAWCTHLWLGNYYGIWGV